MPTSKPSKSRGRPVARVGDSELVGKRRAQIVKVATQLIARDGFAKTVVRDIAKEADISVGLVYEYVRTKEDILFLIFDYWANIYESTITEIAATGKPPLERFSSIVDWLVKEAHENYEMTLLFYREVGNLTSDGRKIWVAQEKRYVKRIIEVLEEGKTDGSVAKDVDCELAATNCLFLASGWALKRHILQHSRTWEEYAAWIVTCVLCAGT
ncbi:MAG TPA: TetR/AcrR family transcriptional regulator [Streptosporangiaceae bacterium]|jgi:AcrR family transcriptional regulator